LILIKKGYDVPAGAVAVDVPARLILVFSGKEIQVLTDNKLSDPITEVFKFLGRKIESPEKRTAELAQHQTIRAELDQYVEEKKQEIMRMFSSEK
jgi:hypothetical protein